MVNFELLPYQVLSGKENMQFDEEILEKSIRDSSDSLLFRLYGWSPACVSLGCNQKKEFLNNSLMQSLGIDVVTRLTGGRALLHDKELTYSIVCPIAMLQNGQSVVASYKELSAILSDVLNKIGIQVSLGGESVHTSHDYCMLVSTGADLNYCGKKLVGSAQCRRRGYILQHGSILFDYDRALLEKIFKEKVDTTAITTIKEILPQLEFDTFVEGFQRAVIECLSQRVF